MPTTLSGGSGVERGGDGGGDGEDGWQGASRRATLVAVNLRRSPSDDGLLGRLHSLELCPGSPQRKQTTSLGQSRRRCPASKHRKQSPCISGEISRTGLGAGGAGSPWSPSPWRSLHLSRREGRGCRQAAAGYATTGTSGAGPEASEPPEQEESPSPETTGCSPLRRKEEVTYLGLASMARGAGEGDEGTTGKRRRGTRPGGRGVAVGVGATGDGKG
ncbi:hypothetical protein ZWY2020_040153 [Hordeum vulgare]|nr:hypothetical protein ZWY2020_040153 [Hordeum vulgare]